MYIIEINTSNFFFNFYMGSKCQEPVNICSILDFSAIKL